MARNVNCTEAEEPYPRRKVLPLLSARKMKAEKYAYIPTYTYFALNGPVLAAFSTCLNGSYHHRGIAALSCSIPLWTLRHQKKYVQAM